MRKTAFSKYLIEYNGLYELGFEEWVFRPGMLFNAWHRWWVDEGSRDRPHEGLDLCLYRDEDGRIHSINKGAEIPMMYEGEIVKIHDDFLGKSVYASHDIYDDDGNQLYTIYGHVQLHGGVGEGKSLGEGDGIATIPDAGRKRVDIPVHLHISVAWIPDSLPHDRLGWEVVGDPSVVTLVDPLEVIDCKYTVI